MPRETRRFAALLGVLAVLAAVGAAKAPPAAPTTNPARPAAPAKAALPTPDPALQKILDGQAPPDAARIKAMQAHVRAVSARVTPATVGVRIGASSASGVVVTPDGYVMTCAHVTQQADVPVTIYFPDGRRAAAKTLGADFGVDAGLIKITDKPKGKGGWPFCPIGTSASLKHGQWCIASGHPGGFRAGRTPPMRLGRVLRQTSGAIVTDCTIVSGDSGGPLFDMVGRVVGIGSRIAGPLDANVHVPADAHTSSWTRLARGETWGRRTRGGAFLGVQSDQQAPDARVAYVQPRSAAARAGIKAGDVITKFDGKDVKTFTDLVAMIAKKKQGDKVKIVVQRGKRTLTLEAALGKREG